jgi:malate dehydrogenase (oxaloacetate-decarboxylating)
VATGSPFDPVHFDGHHHRIGQANNIYIFPGVGLGVTVGKVRRVTDEMFLDAAKTLATNVTDGDLHECAVYPTLNRIRECSQSVACAVIRRAVSQGHAKPSALPELEERVACSMWHPEYMPMRYEL